MTFFVAVGTVLVFAGCSRPADHAGHDQAAATSDKKIAGQKYHCPMHPTYVSNRPGECPICHMDLVPIEDDGQPAGVSAVAGRAVVNLPAERRQLIGLTTDTVAPRVVASSIRTVGRVEYAEPRVAWINAKIAGWIEKLHVDSTGQFVKQGEPLLEIYSPELVSAQEEYLVALRRGDAAGVRAARRRLELWDITAAQVTELETSGEVRKTLPLVSPFDGYVVDKHALPGQAVRPGENLYRVADLSQVWIQADLYEFEMDRVQPGQRVFVTTSYAEARPVIGKIAYVYPYLEAQTRTATVRIEAANPNLDLKPGMYVDVGIETAKEEVLSVPASAVIDTGTRRIAFVDGEEGRLEPREVEIGQRGEDYWEVVSGLADGERVVTRALFLVDSESQLKAAIAGMAHQH